MPLECRGGLAAAAAAHRANHSATQVPQEDPQGWQVRVQGQMHRTKSGSFRAQPELGMSWAGLKGPITEAG